MPVIVVVVMAMMVAVIVVPVIMAVIMAVIVSAAARIPMVMMVVMMVVVVMIVVLVIGRDQGGCELVLDGGCLLAVAACVLDRERHDLGGEADVVGVTEIVAPEPACAIEHEERGRTLHLVGRERLRRTLAVRLVDADREGPLVLALENLEGLLGHHIMVLEDRVQADDRNLVRTEALSQSPRLRQSLRYTAGAKHLKSHQDHDLALEACQGHRFV
jgi:hypothetical protein